MVDISLITSGLSSVQSAVAIINAIRKADGAIEKAELKLRLSDIMSSLADAQIALSTASIHISDLETKLKSRDDLASVNVKYIDGLYVTLDAEGNAIDGPFCGRCWDVSSSKVRTAPDTTKGRDMGFCPECKNSYRLWNAKSALSNSNSE
jgi:hypothetical protein